MDINPERFWSKVDKRGGAECWRWMASVNGAGYGQFTVWGEHRRPFLAHRVAWLLTRGEMPSGYLLHSCDVPCCVNPAHLRVGSQRENIDDMLRRRRSSKGQHVPTRAGENHGGAKLTWVIVDEIRARYAAGGISHRALAAEYDLDHSSIGYIVRQELWHPSKRPVH